MPKYLIEACYTVDGAKGLLKDGGTKRAQAAKAAVESVGGKMEAFYFAFGDTDALVIADMPHAAAAAACSLAINTSGAVTSKTRVLITPDEMDQATKTSARYTPPGR